MVEFEIEQDEVSKAKKHVVLRCFLHLEEASGRLDLRFKDNDNKYQSWVLLSIGRNGRLCRHYLPENVADSHGLSTEELLDGNIIELEKFA